MAVTADIEPRRRVRREVRDGVGLPAVTDDRDADIGLGEHCETPRMLPRAEGMWWGTAIEAPDPGALAAFYSELLGWTIGHEEPGTAIVAAPEGSIYLVFQEALDYERPVWPPEGGRQRPMMHFDFQVADLDASVEEAVALGATLAEHQPHEHVRVLYDPAGHPFCLCLDEE